MLAKKSAWFPTWKKLYENTRQECINLIIIKEESMKTFNDKYQMSYNVKI